MNQLHLFLPCAAGVEGCLADEVHAITGASGQDLLVGRGGVTARGRKFSGYLLRPGDPGLVGCVSRSFD
jgi:hypothetical protein